MSSGGIDRASTTERPWPIHWVAAAVGALAVLAIGVARRSLAAYYDDGAIALNLVAGKGFSLAFHGPEGPTAAHAPFQPFVLAAIHGALGAGSLAVFAVIGLRALAHAAAALCAYPVAIRAVGARRAAVVSALLALHPLLIWTAANPAHLDRRMTISAPLVLLALWAALVACERRSPWSMLVAGLAIGVASLSEPQLLLFSLPAGLVIARGGIGWRPWVRRLATVWLGVAVAVAPWTIRNAVVLRGFVPVRDAIGLVLWAGNNPQATGLWEDEEIMDDPDRRPQRHGALLVGGHPTTFNFRPIHTLPAGAATEFLRMNEVERDQVLLYAAVDSIALDPVRFVELTARRAFYLMAGLPLRDADRFRDVGERLIAAVAPRSSWWTSHRRPAVALLWTAVRGYLLVAFLIALAGTIWVRTPAMLLVASVLSTWLVAFGVTHCGYSGYRFAVEPFVLIGLATAITQLPSRRALEHRSSTGRRHGSSPLFALSALRRRNVGGES